MANIDTTYLDSNSDKIKPARAALLETVQRVNSLSSAVGGTLVGVKGPISGEVLRTLDVVTTDIVHVKRWGGNLKLALTSVPEYTTIVLDATTYDITGLYSRDFNSGAGPFIGNTKKGIRLQGAGMPRPNATGTALEGGTVIQGTLLNLADDFECFDLGVDVGANVITGKYAGAYAEGFVPGANTSYPTAQPTIKGVVVDRVIALGAVPNSDAATFKHTMLFENLEDCKIGIVEAVGGYHTFVSKVVKLQANSITARGGAAGNAAIFKSDPANRCEDNQIANLCIDGWAHNGVQQKAGCLRYEAIDSNNINVTSKIKIGLCTIRNVVTGVDAIQASGTKPIVDCGISHLDVDTGTVSVACLRMGYASADVRRFVIGSHNIVTSGRSFELGAGWAGGHIGNGVQTFIGNAAQPLMTFDSASFAHGVIRMAIDVAQSAPYIIQRNAGDVRIELVSFGGPAGIPSSRFLSSAGGSLVLSANALVGGITAFAAPGATYRPYRVQLRGVIKIATAGANVVLATVVPGPLKNMQFVVPVQTAAGGRAFRTLEILSSGSVTIIEANAVNDLIFMDAVNFDPLTQ